MFSPGETIEGNAIIKVIGVGGGGCNAVRRMHNSNIEKVEFICANTDAQALRECMDVDRTIQLGASLTNGLGAGTKPEIGRQSAIEDRERIVEALTGANLVFIAAGMGGGTGTGAAPVVAEVAKEVGALTVAIVTKPFTLEGKRRTLSATDGLVELKNNVDSLIIIPNDRLFEVLGKSVTITQAFMEADNVLLGAVQGISDLITKSGMINVDFADVQTVMSEMGMAMIGVGEATGEHRAKEATDMAIGCPLLENMDFSGARGLLVNISAGDDLRLEEYHIAAGMVSELTDADANVVIGTSIDPSMGEALRVTLVATGIDSESKEELKPEVVTDKIVSPFARYANMANEQKQLDQPASSWQNDVAQANQLDSGNIAPESEAIVAPKKPIKATGYHSGQSNAPVDERGTSRFEGSSSDDLDIPTFLRLQAD
jgi:cell division protein FtsZ